MKPGENVVFKQVGDELVLLDYASGMYYGLDAVGARIWELIDEGQPVDEIVNILTIEYEAPHLEIASDVTRLVAELRSRGLLVD